MRYIQSPDARRLLALLPSTTHDLALACLYRDAIDLVTFTSRSNTPFLASSIPAACPTSDDLFIRNPEQPLYIAPGFDSSIEPSRMHALFNALDSADLRAVETPDTPAQQIWTKTGVWNWHEKRIQLARNIVVKIHAVTGAALGANGDTAPILWRHPFQTSVDYTGAEVEVPTRRGTYLFRLGERPGSTAAIVKAVQASESRRGSQIDFEATARLLRGIPFVITGQTARIIRGATVASEWPLKHIDVAVRSCDVSSAQAKVADQPGLLVNAISDHAFQELQSFSTSHMTQSGMLAIGPASQQLVVSTLAVGRPGVRA